MREMNKLYFTRFGFRDYYPKGIDVFEEDWDNLIILDSCRYDIFKEESDLSGSLEKRVSRGSMSKGFVEGNFSDKTLHDVVYVSGNSWYGKIHDSINSEVHHYELITPAYPEKPHEITEKAKAASERYPNKRLLVHYMLPHAPYIGETANKKVPGDEYQRERMFADLRSNNTKLSDSDLREMYRENLNIVLPYVSELLEKFSGKTVVTADHGELLGERVYPIPYNEYGHPNKMYIEELVEIPWLVYSDGDRKEILSEQPSEKSRSNVSNEEIEQNLRELGYLQ
jgi:hypothetical protein